jgi:hypothetical protein
MKTINLTLLGLPESLQKSASRLDLEDYQIYAEINDNVKNDLINLGINADMSFSSDPNTYYVNKDVFKNLVIKHSLTVKSIYANKTINDKCLGWGGIPNRLRDLT